MAADVFLSFHLICDCCRARVVSCFIITRVTVLVGVYCYWYGSIRFLCYTSISSYRTAGCLLLLVWQHSILVLYLYIELPYWWVSIVTGMAASISSYRTGGCLLLLVWQHSILVLYMHYDCHMMAMPGYMYHNKNCLINICNTKTV